MCLCVFGCSGGEKQRTLTDERDTAERKGEKKYKVRDARVS